MLKRTLPAPAIDVSLCFRRSPLVMDDIVMVTVTVRVMILPTFVESNGDNNNLLCRSPLRGH